MCRPIQRKGDDYEDTGNDDSDSATEAEHEEGKGQQAEGCKNDGRQIPEAGIEQRSPPRQQEGDRPETAPQRPGSDHCRDRKSDRLAEPQHSRVPQRAGDEEDEAEGRVHEERSWRTNL
jgi:hypothetical protein